MEPGRDHENAAQAYCAAFDLLGDSLGPGWDITDWDDRTLRWRLFAPRGADSPSQGWKVHVSAAAVEGPALLCALGAVFSSLEVPFKVPRAIDDVVFINSGDGKRSVCRTR